MIPFSGAWEVRGRFARLAVLLFSLWLLGGCGLLGKNSELGLETPPQESPDAKKAEDALQDKPVPYSLDIVIRDGPSELEGKMKDASQLLQLKGKPPDSMLGLERRARADTETAVKLLHSQLYYDGEASFHLDAAATPVKVTLTLAPGRRYVVGRAEVRYEPPPVVPESFKHRRRGGGLLGWDEYVLPPPSFPESLPDVLPGESSTADVILAAVDSLPEKLKMEGYPFARVADARYTLDREARHLNVAIVVDPGSPAYMGPVRVQGAERVSAAYMERLAPWDVGKEPWDSSVLENYANALRASGLFGSVEAKPVADAVTPGREEGGIPVLPVEVTVKEAPFRTISGKLRYDTDTGPGMEASWEHRNLFGSGEKLTVKVPVSEEMQGLKAAFEKPAFLTREQRLLADASLLNEDTDAYRNTAASASLGIERRLARYWWGGGGVFAEYGSVKDHEHPEETYGVFGPQFFLRRDSRDNALNPTEGSHVKLTVKPFTGFYEEDLTAVSGVVSASAYYAPFGRRDDGRPDDTVVLAGKVEAGAMTGAALGNIPSSLRFFAGGAGSVRGYAYQALGPRDREDKPLGGRSFQTVNLEARFKITENMGIVPFIDGGMVYSDELPPIVGDMRWGTGLGLRYYTPIGPLRLDVATPLNPISGDPLVQVYLSVGQSF